MSDTPAPFDMPPVSAGFDARGGWYLKRLMADLALTKEQAAGIVGAAGAESGLEAIQEKHPVGGRGGFGWHQPTGPRRIAFEKFCADHDMNTTDDQANYLFTLEELRGSEAHSLEQLRKTTTVEAACYTFIVQYERPANPDAETTRAITFANRALAAAGHTPPLRVDYPVPATWQPPVTPPVTPPPPVPVQPPSFVMPPIASGTVAGGISLVAMMLVKQAVFAFSLLHIAVSDELQSITVGGLVVLIGWFLHTRLSKALLLDQAK